MSYPVLLIKSENSISYFHISHFSESTIIRIVDELRVRMLAVGNNVEIISNEEILSKLERPKNG